MRSNMSGILIAGGLLACAAQAAPPTVVITCGTLSTAGSYILAHDLFTQFTEPCLIISGPDITVNMDGHSILPGPANSFSSRMGIRVTGTGARIQDGNIRNLTGQETISSIAIQLESSGARVTGMNTSGNNVGINMQQSDDNRVDGNTISDNLSVGIQAGPGSDNNYIGGNQCSGNGGTCVRLIIGEGNSVVGNTMNNNGLGVSVAAGSANEVRSNSITGGERGVFVTSALNIVRNNTITGARTGIRLRFTATGNTVRNNSVTGSIEGDIVDEGTVCDDTFSNNTFTSSTGPAGCIH